MTLGDWIAALAGIIGVLSVVGGRELVRLRDRVLRLEERRDE